MLFARDAQFFHSFLGDNITTAAGVNDKAADAVFDCTAGTENVGS